MRSLLKQLNIDHPTLTFLPGEQFMWSPDSRTICYVDTAFNAEYFLLHELSHALLEHSQYYRDIDLLKLERDAWSYASDYLSQLYNITIDNDSIQRNLDTYRDWLHARSTCPHCHSTGLQIKKTTYSCIACNKQWHVNEARSCALRRYSI